MFRYGLIGRSMIDMARTAFGAKRAPVRNGAPESEGRPMMAASMPSSVVACGRRMKVGTPQKRGVSSESMGSTLMSASSQAERA